MDGRITGEWAAVREAGVLQALAFRRSERERERERTDGVFAGKTGEHKEEKRRERSP